MQLLECSDEVLFLCSHRMDLHDSRVINEVVLTQNGLAKSFGITDDST